MAPLEDREDLILRSNSHSLDKSLPGIRREREKHLEEINDLRLKHGELCHDPVSDIVAGHTVDLRSGECGTSAGEDCRTIHTYLG